jgi:hypothetical protein
MQPPVPLLLRPSRDHRHEAPLQYDVPHVPSGHPAVRWPCGVGDLPGGEGTRPKKTYGACGHHCQTPGSDALNPRSVAGTVFHATAMRLFPHLPTTELIALNAVFSADLPGCCLAAPEGRDGSSADTAASPSGRASARHCRRGPRPYEYASGQSYECWQRSCRVRGD